MVARMQSTLPGVSRSWARRFALGAAALPVLILLAAVPFVRPIADDLCYEATLPARGFAQAWVDYLGSWTGTWVQHGSMLLVAMSPGWTGYALQFLLLLALLAVACWLLTEDLLTAAGLLVCSLAALQGSLVGPAYPGLAGSLAWPSASVLHLLPVLLWLPLTHRWSAGGRSGPPLLTGAVLAVVLTGTGSAEGGAALLCWVALAAAARLRRAPLMPWLLPSAVLAVGLTAVFFSPGSSNRVAQLELQPSSAALGQGPLLDFVAYAVLYTGGVVTSPGVLLALLLGLAVGRSDRRPAALVPLLAAPALLVAQAGAGVFAYPAFWHLQGLQFASAVAALEVGRLASPRLAGVRLLRRTRPEAVVVLAALAALLPAVVTTTALVGRQQAFDAAYASRDSAQPVLPGFALGTPGGATIPDAGAGLPGFADCWQSWSGTTTTTVEPRPSESRAVLPTIPLPVLQ